MNTRNSAIPIALAVAAIGAWQFVGAGDRGDPQELGPRITVRASAITGGGVVASGGEFSAISSVGPPVSGVAAGGTFTAGGGFLPGAVLPPPCPADINDDGVVNAADLAFLLGAWGPNPGHPADLDGNGTVAASDLALLLGTWGPCS